MNQHKHLITLICDVLNISRATCFQYRTHLDEDYPDYQIDKELFLCHKMTLDYRGVTSLIHSTHVIVMNHKRVQLIMNKYGLLATYFKKFPPNHKKQYQLRVVQADYLQRKFNQIGWETIITYLMMTVKSKQPYLSTILDLETRDCVANRIHNRNDTEIFMSTLQQAFPNSKEKI